MTLQDYCAHLVNSGVVQELVDRFADRLADRLADSITENVFEKLTDPETMLKLAMVAKRIDAVLMEDQA